MFPRTYPEPGTIGWFFWVWRNRLEKRARGRASYDAIDRALYLMERMMRRPRLYRLLIKRGS